MSKNNNQEIVVNEEKYLDRKKLLMMAVGTFVGSGLVSLTGVAAAETGYSVWLSYIIAVIIGFTSALPFVLMSSVMSFRGGTYSIATTFLGGKYGGAFAFLSLLNALGLAIMATAFGLYVQSVFDNASIMISAIAIVGVMWFVNVMGIEFLASVQKYTTYILLISLVVFVAFALPRLNPDTLNFSGPEFFINGRNGLFAAIALLVFSAQSYDVNVYTYSRYTIDSKKNMPWGMTATMVALALIYGLVSMAAVGAKDLQSFAGQTLTVPAKAILPTPLFYAFVIGGPILCLITTVNGYLGALTIGIAKACEDNWLPRSFAKTNKKGAYYLIITVVSAVCLIPIIAGLNIGKITNITVAIGSLFHIPLIISMGKLPKMFPEEFKNSGLKWLTEKLYYFAIAIALLARLFITYISIAKLSTTLIIALVITAAICFVFSFVRYKSGQVELSHNYFFD
ncbi:MAG: APC family permease [Christensenellaceae bacterium]|nr:APC family permease [Christensenellaceae bacterium]